LQKEEEMSNQKQEDGRKGSPEDSALRVVNNSNSRLPNRATASASPSDKKSSGRILN
jgi:hypothetical protein